MARVQTAEARVPQDLSLDVGVPNLRAYLHRVMRGRCRRWRRWRWWRRTFRLNCENVRVVTDDDVIVNECSLPDALSAIEDGARVMKVAMEIKSGRNAERVEFVWQRNREHKLVIVGTDSTWVLGMREGLERSFRAGRYNQEIEPPSPRRGRLKSWVKPIVIAALGAVLAAVLTALGGEALGWFGDDPHDAGAADAVV